VISRRDGNLVELNAVHLVHVRNESARPDGAIDWVLGTADCGVRLERDSARRISSFGVAPTEQLEDVFLLFLDEPGRETLGDELGRRVEANWEQVRTGVNECASKGKRLT